MEKAPPHNLQAEEAVIGGLLIDQDAFLRIAGTLKPQMFYREKNGWIYAAIEALRQRNEPVDLLTVGAELEKRRQLDDIGGTSYLSGAIDKTPTSIHTEHYAKIVRDLAGLRSLITAAGKIAALGYAEEDDIATTYELAEQMLFQTTGASEIGRPRFIREAISPYYDHVEGIASHSGALLGIPTTYTDLDILLQGLQRQELTLLAARPSMGKTSLALNIAYRAALKFNQRVLFFSMEMGETALIERLISLHTGIPFARIRKAQFQGDEWKLFMSGLSQVRDLPIALDTTSSWPVLGLRGQARRFHAEHGIDLIIADYVQLMHGETRTYNRVQEVAQISQGLKALAKELRVPVLALSQLSRALESRVDKRPVLSDLRESGALEQDADVVLFIYRDDVYNEPAPEVKDLAEIICAKHRNGPTGTIYLRWVGPHMRFDNVDIHAEQSQMPFE